MFLAAGAAVNYTIPQKIAAVRKTLAESISVEFIHRPDVEAKCTWKSCPFQQRSFKLDLWLRIQFSSFSCPSSPTLTAGRCMVEMSFSLLSLFSTPSLHPQRWQVSTLNHSVLVSYNRIPPPSPPPAPQCFFELIPLSQDELPHLAFVALKWGSFLLCQLNGGRPPPRSIPPYLEMTLSFGFVDLVIWRQQ